jgi:hypothetical protein
VKMPRRGRLARAGFAFAGNAEPLIVVSSAESRKYH